MGMELDLRRAVGFMDTKDFYSALCNFNWRRSRPGLYMSYQKTDLILEALKAYEVDHPDIIVNNPIVYVFLYVV